MYSCPSFGEVRRGDSGTGDGAGVGGVRPAAAACRPGRADVVLRGGLRVPRCRPAAARRRALAAPGAAGRLAQDAPRGDRQRLVPPEGEHRGGHAKGVRPLRAARRRPARGVRERHAHWPYRRARRPAGADLEAAPAVCRSPRAPAGRREQHPYSRLGPQRQPERPVAAALRPGGGAARRILAALRPADGGAGGAGGGARPDRRVFPRAVEPPAPGFDVCPVRRRLAAVGGAQRHRPALLPGHSAAALGDLADAALPGLRRPAVPVRRSLRRRAPAALRAAAAGFAAGFAGGLLRAAALGAGTGDDARRPAVRPRHGRGPRLCHRPRRAARARGQHGHDGGGGRGVGGLRRLRLVRRDQRADVRQHPPDALPGAVLHHHRRLAADPPLPRGLRRPGAAERRTGPARCDEERRAAGQPGAPRRGARGRKRRTAPSRVSSPRPATTCASRCMRSGCSPPRCAARSACRTPATWSARSAVAWTTWKKCSAS